MVRVMVRKRTDQRKAVHFLRQLWQVFANLQAWSLGCDGLEVTTEFDRRIRLHVECVDGAQATFEEDIDQRDIFRLLVVSSYGLSQRHAEQAGRTQADAIPAGDSIAISASGHWRYP